MKITSKRNASAAAVLFAGALALTACSNASNNASTDASGSESAVTGLSGELRGEGASSQQNAMDNVFGPAFSGSGATLAYNATGSGAGQTQFIAGQVDFAGSDSALKDEQVAQAAQRCGDNPAWHLPMVIGPVAVAYNVEGVESLNLSALTIAKIFKGEIANWNDPEIAAQNEGATLPDLPISVVYRSEESGTSDNFQKFLNIATDGYWTDEGKSFPTAVGAGANKSTGVADQVAATNGAITYVESGFAKERESQGVRIANVDFGAGAVELNADSVNAALAKVAFSGEGNDLVVDSSALYAQKDAGAYPLVLTTYEIVCSAGYDENTAALVKAFMQNILDNQGADLEEQGYIPLDGEFKDKLQAAVDALA